MRRTNTLKDNNSISSCANGNTGRKRGYNMEKTAYVSISYDTANGARSRVLEELAVLTHGEVEKAMRLINEYKEFDRICKEMEEEK